MSFQCTCAIIFTLFFLAKHKIRFQSETRKKSPLRRRFLARESFPIHEPTRKLCIHDLARCHRPNKMWYALNSHDFKNLFKGFDNTLLPKGLLFCSISNLLAQSVPQYCNMRDKELNIVQEFLMNRLLDSTEISCKFVTMSKKTYNRPR